MTFRASLLYAQKFLFPGRAAASAGGHGKRSLLGAMLCIGISLIPLVAVLVVSDGMIEGITGRMIGLSSQHLSVRIAPASEAVADYGDFAALSERLAGLDGVRAAYPEMQGMALAAGKEGRMGATVRAVPPDIFTRNESFATLFTVQAGAADLSAPRNAVLGQKIAADLHLHAGDTFQLISINKVGGVLVPRLAQFTVAGIVSCGYQELDALWAFIPLETGYSVLAVRSAAFMVGLVTDDPFSPELMAVKQAVAADIAGYGQSADGGRDAVDYAVVYSWDELNSAQYDNFASTKVLLLLIMLLIVLVASVNISSALVMIVMERRKEIAILKSVGASADGITMGFLLVGFAAGLGGVLMGVPLGLVAAVNVNALLNGTEKIVNVLAKFVYLIGKGDVSGYRNVRLLDPAYYLQNVSISVPFKELLVITAGTLVLSLLVAALPAIKAGREKPLDTLRKM